MSTKLMNQIQKSLTDDYMDYVGGGVGPEKMYQQSTAANPQDGNNLQQMINDLQKQIAEMKSQESKRSPFAFDKNNVGSLKNMSMPLVNSAPIGQTGLDQFMPYSLSFGGQTMGNTAMGMNGMLNRSVVQKMAIAPVRQQRFLNPQVFAQGSALQDRRRRLDLARESDDLRKQLSQDATFQELLATGSPDAMMAMQQNNIFKDLMAVDPQGAQNYLQQQALSQQAQDKKNLQRASNLGFMAFEMKKMDKALKGASEAERAAAMRNYLLKRKEMLPAFGKNTDDTDEALMALEQGGTPALMGLAGVALNTAQTLGFALPKPDVPEIHDVIEVSDGKGGVQYARVMKDGSVARLDVSPVKDPNDAQTHSLPVIADPNSSTGYSYYIALEGQTELVPTGKEAPPPSKGTTVNVGGVGKKTSKYYDELNPVITSTNNVIRGVNSFRELVNPSTFDAMRGSVGSAGDLTGSLVNFAKGAISMGETLSNNIVRDEKLLQPGESLLGRTKREEMLDELQLATMKEGSFFKTIFDKLSATDAGFSARNNSQIRSVLEGLVFAVAQAQNPDGRITQNDYEAAVRTINAHKNDPESLYKTVTDQANKIMENYREQHSRATKAFGPEVNQETIDAFDLSNSDVYKDYLAKEEELQNEIAERDRRFAAAQELGDEIVLSELSQPAQQNYGMVLDAPDDAIFDINGNQYTKRELIDFMNQATNPNYELVFRSIRQVNE